MAGIGDELLLFFAGLHHRIDGTAGKQRDDEINTRHAEQHSRQ